MTARLHVVVAVVCLVFALAVGCTHQAPGPGDPSYTPDNAQQIGPLCRRCFPNWTPTE